MALTGAVVMFALPCQGAEPLAFFAPASTPAAGEILHSGDPIILKEHLGYAWSNELVHADFAFAPGEWRTTNVHLADAQDQTISAQFSAVTNHSDGSIRSAEVWFVMSLAPNETRRFTLRPGAAAVSDVKVSPAGNRLEITNGLLGARVRLGAERFPKPVAAGEVPAFLEAVRLRGGAWTGRGWFETPKRCRSYRVELAESGPVFARVTFEYRFDGFRGEGADIYRGTAHITAGQEIIYLTEEFSLGDPNVYHEPQFASEGEELPWDWWKWRPHESPDNFCFRFGGDAFPPTHARCIPHNVTSPTKGRGMNCYGENEYPLLFDTNRFEFTVNAYTMLQPDQALLYTPYRPADPASDIVSLLPCRPSRWRHPDMLPHEPAQIRQHTDTSDLRVYSTANREVIVWCPLHRGRREWAIAVAKNPGVISADVTECGDVKLRTDAPMSRVGRIP